MTPRVTNKEKRSKNKNQKNINIFSTDIHSFDLVQKTSSMPI